MAIVNTIAVTLIVIIAVIVLYIFARQELSSSATSHLPPFVQPYLSFIKYILPSQGIGAQTNSTNANSAGVKIVGNYQKENFTLTNSTNVTVNGNYDRLTLYLNSTAKVNLDVAGSYDAVTVNGGSVYLSGNGSYDVVYISNSTSLNGTITGSNNHVSG